MRKDLQQLSFVMAFLLWRKAFIMFRGVNAMPIKIPDNLPAKEILNGENIFVMDESRAYHQDIRPLKIAILNLMPTKETTARNRSGRWVKAAPMSKPPLLPPRMARCAGEVYL